MSNPRSVMLTEEQIEAQSEVPTEEQSVVPTEEQIEAQSEVPTEEQSVVPTEEQIEAQSEVPTEEQSVVLTEEQIEAQSKVFNDPIHGHIKLHPLLVKFIDTPQFQRLRNIKQLGGNYFVYPGASHNRFEHCIGTCHLAGELVKLLKRKQSGLNIEDKDVLCVQIAGLCHDLGHGPFSHMFDLKFLPSFPDVRKWTVSYCIKISQHEKGSEDMLRYMINDNNLQEEAETKYGLRISPDKTAPGKDFQFITEMIKGPSGNDKTYKGRDVDKHFLYEIISNERNKVDVDKWDYLARDCHHLGLKNSFDHIRFMHHLKVLEVDGVRQICVRDKEASNLYELFHIRSKLHLSAYQHRTKISVETMICDAMKLANNHIKYCGRDGTEYTIAQCVNEPSAFIKLTDHVFHEILHSKIDCNAMRDAKKILERIQKRNLYQCMGTKKLTGTSDEVNIIIYFANNKYYFFHKFRKNLIKSHRCHTFEPPNDGAVDKLIVFSE
ncbi:deoxynucleoside triphosphate triphosphohydrolase SAMHD1-like [Ciona intestinalis]